MNKRNIKKLGAVLAVLLLVCLVLAGAGAADTSGTCGGGLTWSVDEDNHLTITYDGIGSGYMDSYGHGYPAPWGKNITSVSLPDGIKNIGYYAFGDCTNLIGSINIPSSVVRIDGEAFYNCIGLSKIDIPKSVTSIGAFAFSGCSGLPKIDIPTSVTTIGSSAFSNCDGLTKIEIPSSITTIENYTFSNCDGLTKVVIPSGVTSIGEGAFQDCSSLSSVYIPNSVNRIYDKAFSNMADNSIIYSFYKTSYLVDKSSFSNYSSNKTILALQYKNKSCNFIIGNHSSFLLTDANSPLSSYTFEGWYENKDFTGEAVNYIEDNMTLYPKWSSTSGTCGDGLEWSISDNNLTITYDNQGNGYMDNYSINSPSPWDRSITSVSLPDGLKDIGNFAFYTCSSLTGPLTIPSSVTTIGSGAFSSCRGLTGSLTIPSSVTTIGSGAFGGCSGLTGSLTIPSSVTTIGSGAFSSCRGLTGSITIPNGITKIESSLFSDCTGLNGYLTIPSSVTSIGASAFNGCSGLNGSLTIPSSVTNIGISAFRNCSGLTGSLIIPSGVTSIGNYSFYGCNGFTGSLTIPSSVTTIGEWAFYNCTGFDGSLTFENGVTSIGSSAFNSCSGFTGSLTIPSSVTTIGEWAFGGCSGFTGSLTIPSSITIIEKCTFVGCSGFTGSLTIEHGVSSIGDSAFSGCRGFTGSLTIPSSVTTIGSSAFNCCSGFTGSLSLPSNLQRIEDKTFNNCSGFTGSLVIPSGVTIIGENAFTNCSGFTGSLIIPSNVSYIGYMAFGDCVGLSGSITIPSSLQTIGLGLINNCQSITDIIVDSNNPYYKDLDGVLYSKDSRQIIIYPAGKTQESYEVPNETNSILGYAFNSCKNLKSIILPANISYIGSSAFTNCSDNSIIYVLGNSSLLSGKYSSDKTAIAKYNGNDSYTFTVDSSSFPSGFQLNETNAPFKDGWVFIGWYNDSGDEVTSVSNGQKIYAQWESNIPETVSVFWYQNNLTDAGLQPEWTYTSPIARASFTIPPEGNLVLNEDNAPAGIYYHYIGSVPPEYDQIVYISAPTLTKSDISEKTIYNEITPNVTKVTVENAANINMNLVFRKEGEVVRKNTIPGTTITTDDNKLFNITIEDNAAETGDWIVYVKFETGTTAGTLAEDAGNYAYVEIGTLKIAQKKEEDSASMTVSATEVQDGDLFEILVAGPKNTTGTLTDTGVVTVKYYKDGETSSDAVDMTTTSENLNFIEGQAQMISGSDRAFAIPNSGQCTIGIQANTGLISDTTYHFEVYVTGCGAEKAGGINNPLKGEILVVSNPEPGYSEYLKLRAGWNFISVPMKLDASMDTTSEYFSDVDMDSHSVLGYDSSTKSWVQLSADTVLKPLDAYWVYSKTDFVGTKKIVFDAESVSIGNTKEIYKGWNAVGLNIDVTQGKNSLSAKSTFAGLDWNRYFEKYTTGAWTVIVNGGSTSESEENYIYAGAGGWLYANEDGVLVGNSA